jgi:methionine salvage enolase-phosphatase E1
LSLLSDIEAAVVKRGPVCTVSLVRDSLPPGEQAEYDDAIRNPRFAATTVAKVLRNHGHEINAEAIQRHRRGVCRCH